MMKLQFICCVSLINSPTFLFDVFNQGLPGGEVSVSVLFDDFSVIVVVVKLPSPLCAEAPPPLKLWPTSPRMW